MMKSLALIPICLAALAVTIKSQGSDIENPDNRYVVCYYTNWSPYRPGDAKFTQQQIDPFLCTHLVYAFATFSDGKIVSSDSAADIDNNGFKLFNDLKNVNKNLKTLLSIGGTAEGPRRFSSMALTGESRDTFTKSAVKLLREHNFDGINIDWHYPSLQDGSRPEDKLNCVELVKALKEEFEKEAEESKKPRMLITMSLPKHADTVEKGFDLVNLQKYMDFFNLLSYDYHVSDKTHANHHAPLYPTRKEFRERRNLKENADASVQYLLKNGVEKQKLILGIPTYGRTYQLKSGKEHRLGSLTVGHEGEPVGFKPYFETCKTIKDEQWTIIHPNRTALGPYAFKGQHWISFDDETSAHMKGEYARNKGLGGIMFWTVDLDDFSGKCGKRNFPIIRAAKDGLLGKQ